MTDLIEFSNNYNDLSTDAGFQFEFICDRCGSGYRTPFQATATGTITNALETASSIFGGVFGSAANISEQVRNAGWQRARDAALTSAIAMIRPAFVQCPRCQSWVCRKKCWNDKRGLCKQCAPDMGVEMSAAQASRSVEEVWAHAAMSEEDKKLSEANWRETIKAACPKCEAPLATNAKFCPNCGEPLKSKTHCTQCGGLLQPGAKFCGECGAKTG
jgi:DNA-directed RNA polymerase subunit M/transcription elongation factor TFIIS